MLLKTYVFYIKHNGQSVPELIIAFFTCSSNTDNYFGIQRRNLRQIINVLFIRFCGKWQENFAK